ncbi:MAG: hypothetical protein ABI400_08060 [Lacisediminihabitans sp.]
MVKSKPSPSGDGWREPTSRHPLRWGSYRFRYAAALTLLLVGGVLVQTGSAYALYLLTLGLAIHLLGWWILPGRGWRRFWMSLPSALIMLVLLTGAESPAALVIPLAGWLYVRERPARSYPVLLAPFAAGVILGQAFPQYGSGAIVVAIATAVLVGSAWLARLIANSGRTPSHTPASAR